MKLGTCAALLCALIVIAHAADHQWQHGIWRDVQRSVTNGSSISIPMGGTPPTTVAGVTMPGTSPMYLAIPTTAKTECVTIDGTETLRYVACWHRELPGVIINDPVDFAVEGKDLFVKGTKKDEVFKLSIEKTIRIERP